MESLVSLKPNEEVKITYGQKAKISIKLVKMIDPVLGAEYESKFHYLDDVQAYIPISDKNKICQALYRKIDPVYDEVIYGAIAFGFHVGDIYLVQDCEAIVSALKKLAETDNDESIQNLIKVFDDAVNSDGVVAIRW